MFLSLQMHRTRTLTDKVLLRVVLVSCGFMKSPNTHIFLQDKLHINGSSLDMRHTKTRLMSLVTIGHHMTRTYPPTCSPARRFSGILAAAWSYSEHPDKRTEHQGSCITSSRRDRTHRIAKERSTPIGRAHALRRAIVESVRSDWF